jgi:glycosyltransferase involved in cell wall biosynthesis
MLSIIIPAYNRPLELKRALDSLVSQTYQDFEVVVCDDGSEDDIKSVVRRFNDNLDVTYIRIENSGGPARPRNTAIAASKYEWISFLDSDDWWMPNRMEAVVKAIEKNPGYGVFYHKLQIAAVRNTPWWTSRIIGSKIGRDHFVHLMTRGNCLTNSSVVVARNWFDKIGPLNESKEYASVEDCDYWLRLARQGAQFYFIDECLGFYWLGLDGISSDPGKFVGKNQMLYQSHMRFLGRAHRSAAESQLCYRLATIHLTGSNCSEAYRLLRKATNLASYGLRLRRILKLLFVRLELLLG